ncbi:hypothetical protein BLS_006516 [Venturia inaequalis]|uniref:Uncharacterized protein n=1 Tax=Venturia inaequalis TaxID=5025 RepID=A0A8H3YPG3_VENIN|nr:hypothetical protein BLS_006516 [Venturia inaequalis]
MMSPVTGLKDAATNDSLYSARQQTDAVDVGYTSDSNPRTPLKGKSSSLQLGPPQPRLHAFKPGRIPAPVSDAQSEIEDFQSCYNFINIDLISDDRYTKASFKLPLTVTDFFAENDDVASPNPPKTLFRSPDQRRRSTDLLQEMDGLLYSFGTASHKFVQFLHDNQGQFDEFQQALNKVSDFASVHHGEFAASSGLVSLIGYSRGSHADHARRTAEKIPGMIELYRSKLHRGGSSINAVATSRESDGFDLTTTPPQAASPHTPPARNSLNVSNSTSRNSSPFAASTPTVSRFQAAGRFRNTPDGQVDQEALLMLRFKHIDNETEGFSYKIESPADWSNKKQVDNAHKIALQYIARKCGTIRHDKRPSYHPQDAKWILDYMAAKMKLTKAEAGGIDWTRLSQISPAIKQITADYNARDCVVNGDHTLRTETAIFQKISRMPEMRPLRGMYEPPKKRKFRKDAEEDGKEAEEASPLGLAKKKIAPDLDGRVGLHLYSDD